MISIIIVSINNKLFQEVSSSINVSLNLDFEIIKIDNIRERLSIAKAYNRGALQAKYDFLVFVHEDVLFHTFNWGKILVDYFYDLDKVGVIGVAGSSYIPISPSDWWLSNPAYLHSNFYSNKKNGKIGDGLHKRWGQQTPQKVFALDGMFLAMKKSVWEEFPFDESLIGFHGYDTSICYQVSKKYQNYFVPDILLEHFSKGYPNEIWLINTVKANDSNLAHIIKTKKNSLIDEKLEVKAYHLFLNQLKKFSSSYLYSFIYSSKYLWRNLKFFFDIRLIILWVQFQFVLIKKVR